MSKIKRIQVSNLKAVSSLTADFNGCTAIVTGGNRKGKSTFLKSLIDRIRDGHQPNVLKLNEKNGFAEMELTTGEKFTWQFGEGVKKGELLKFTTRDELRLDVTKEIIQRFFPETFNIDSFLLSTPLAKRKTLEKICGIDVSEIKLKLDKAFEDRKFEKKTLAELEAQFAGLNFDETLPNQETPTEAMLEAMQEVERKNADIERNKAVLEQKKIYRANKAAELEKLVAELNALDVEIGKVTAALNSPKNQIVPMDDMRNEYALVVEENRKIKENVIALHTKTKIDVAVKNVAKYDADVKKYRDEIDARIKKSSLPAGFEFTDEGINYNGFPLERESQASSALYMAALKLASLTLGQVKTMHFDASFLDRNSLQEIEQWANENDYQLLIERPDFDGGEITYEILQS